jgi:hypothetical protein
MDFPLHRSSTEAFPWRTATMLVAGVAAVELVLLVVVGGALLAKSSSTSSRPAAKAKTAATVKAPAKAKASAPTARTKTAPVATAELPRRKVEVLVLNGNGRAGAAGAAASRVGRRGYQVTAVANAPRQDYPQSIVLFRRGFEGEGQRLARDLGVKVVGPLDGIRTGQLHGAHVVLILGA